MKNFHGWWTNHLKNKTGASFCAWETHNGKTRLKMIINGEPKYLNLTGDFSGVTIETYTQLLKEITE